MTPQHCDSSKRRSYRLSGLQRTCLTGTACDSVVERVETSEVRMDAAVVPHGSSKRLGLRGVFKMFRTCQFSRRPHSSAVTARCPKAVAAAQNSVPQPFVACPVNPTGAARRSARLKPFSRCTSSSGRSRRSGSHRMRRVCNLVARERVVELDVVNDPIRVPVEVAHQRFDFAATVCRR